MSTSKNVDIDLDTFLDLIILSSYYPHQDYFVEYTVPNLKIGKPMIEGSSRKEWATLAPE